MKASRLEGTYSPMQFGPMALMPAPRSFSIMDRSTAAIVSSPVSENPAVKK